ncbi:hypothetical protein DSECCO2_635470 [anaerobic digester metagenome]
MNNIAGQGFIFVRFRQAQFIFLIQVVYFQTTRKQIFIFIQHIFNQIFHIKFIIYFTENFFYYVFHGYHTGSSAKFIHYQGNAFALLHKHIKHPVGLHSFRHDKYRFGNAYY